jgi:hypothetical protein
MIPVAKRTALHATAFSLRLTAKSRIGGPVIGTTGIWGSGGTSELFEAVRFGFGVDIAPSSWWFREPRIFGRHAITPADVGKTFYEDATTDPSFAEVASRLTNGVDDIAFLVVSFIPDFGSGGGSGVEESIAFRGSDLLNGIDFSGHTISRIGMRVDSLDFFVDEEQINSYTTSVTILVEQPSPFSESIKA